MVDVNIRALTTLTRHYAGKRMLGREQGENPECGVYRRVPTGSWNGGVLRNQVARAVLLEVAPRIEGDGVTVTTYAPGYVETGFGEVAGMNLRREIKSWERDSRQQGRLDRCEGNGEGQARGDSVFSTSRSRCSGGCSPSGFSWR